ncbi:hypothetical protein PybrP1_011756, partial [[Pythium] brassicae (nom. inval.)]
IDLPTSGEQPEALNPSRRRQRCMRDDERLDVIRRVQSGEKQSNIAREYGFTRAAVCNTYKNRQDILRRIQVQPRQQQSPQSVGRRGVGFQPGSSSSGSGSGAIGIGNGGYPLLRGFEDMMIDARTGFIAFGSRDVQLQARHLTYSLPSDLRSYNVLLMDCECVTGAAALQAINILCDEGVPEQAIVFVCVLAAREGVQNILSTFPGVRVVTASVDPDVQRHSHPTILPGCGIFLDRYYDSEVVFGRLI